MNPPARGTAMGLPKSRALRLYLLLVLALVANYLAIALWSGPRLSAAAGGMMPFDTRIAGYSEGQARRYLAALGNEGRDFYLHVGRWLDTSFPVLLALVLGGALWWLYAEKSRAMRIALLGIPLVAAAADLAENARIAAMMRLDVPSAGLIASASQATVLKFILDGAGVALVVVGIAGHWRAR